MPYSLIYICINTTKIDNNIGPNIMPKKPNKFTPTTTPNIVVSGCTLANFLATKKRTTLSIPPITTKPQTITPMPYVFCPCDNMYKPKGMYTSIVPTIGTTLARAVNKPSNKNSLAPKMAYPIIATIPCAMATIGIPIALL